jgi:hypothetical protein
VLNRLWRLAGDRFNYLTPTNRPIGFASNVNGKRKRLYDTPKTPLDRLLAAHVLAPEQEAELLAYRDPLNPAAIGRQIAELQVLLLKLAKDNSEQSTSPRCPAPCPMSAKASESKPAEPTSFSHAFLIEAPNRFRGQFALRHYASRLGQRRNSPLINHAKCSNRCKHARNQEPQMRVDVAVET